MASVDQASVSDLEKWLKKSDAHLAKRSWFEFPGYHLKVYLRHTQHTIGQQRVNTIDVASIEVEDGYRGQGHFKTWIYEVERLADSLKLLVYVESVIEPRLARFLDQRGYARVRHSIPPCYLRRRFRRRDDDAVVVPDGS